MLRGNPYSSEHSGNCIGETLASAFTGSAGKDTRPPGDARISGRSNRMKTRLASLLIIGLVTMVSVVASAAPQDVAKALLSKDGSYHCQRPNWKSLVTRKRLHSEEGVHHKQFSRCRGCEFRFRAPNLGIKPNTRSLDWQQRDEFRDLVVLAVEGMEEDGVLLSQRASVEVGETVFAVGNPRGLEGTFSKGIVSSVREIDGFSLLQITAPISPGSSGGPITDEKGEVIGVAVATFKGGQNLNFAIPAKYVSDIESKIGEIETLSQSAVSSKGKSLLDNLEAGKSTEGLSAGSFLWDGDTGKSLGNNGYFTISLKNNLDSAVRDTFVLVLFYDELGEVVDFTVVTYNGLIPAGMGKRVNGKVDPSTKRLTTAISRSNEYMYSDRPNTKLEFRTLGFTLESD